MDTHIKAKLLAYMREHSFRMGKITLSSGMESDWYINCKLSLHPDALNWASNLFYSKIMTMAPSAKAVGGLTMGADPWATALVMYVYSKGRDLLPFYVRKEPKSHGSKQWLEGTPLPAGTQVAIIEDVITTGASAIKAIERVREHDLNPVLCMALVDRCEEEGRQNITAMGVPTVSIFSRYDFLY